MTGRRVSAEQLGVWMLVAKRVQPEFEGGLGLAMT